MKSLLLITLSFLFLYGCSEEVDSVDYSSALQETADELVIKNCTTVQEAARAFAAQNDGSYPTDTDSDRTLLGNTLIDLLPNGERLENPYTHAVTEPICGVAANPGETGYSGYSHIYVISGFGSVSTIIMLDNIEELEDAIRADCFIVQQAVEDWADQNNGTYPGNIGTHENIEGNTVIDLLPDGIRLINRFTLASTNPLDGIACSPGDISYKPQEGESSTVGYVITGAGHTGNTIIYITKE